MPHQITKRFCITWQNWGNTKIAFLLKCCSALPEFKQLLLDFFNLFDSRFILTLLCNSLSLVINAFSSELFGRMVQRPRYQ